MSKINCIFVIMIKIKFKSNVDFTNSSETFKATEWQYIYKDGRIIKKNVLALDVIDNWNGIDISVQKTIWDGYTLDFDLNESQANLLTILATCNTIVIEDIDNNLTLDVDNSNSEYFTYELGDLLGQTTNYKVIINFRSNKKIINLQVATEQISYLKINTNYYYSDNDVIITIDTPKIETVEDNNGLKKSVSSDYKKLLSLVFYLDENDKNNLVDDMANNDISNITINDGTTTYDVLENVIITPDNLGLDLFKCVVPCVIDANRNYL